MRRARPQRSNIMKFLEEIGYEDIFDGNEVKEIKDMLNKNVSNMTKNELMLESIQKFEADPEEEIKEDTGETNSQNGSNSGSKSPQVSTHLPICPSQTFSLLSHVDCVRAGMFLPQLDLAVTASEDCTLKLWDLKNISRVPPPSHNFIDDFSDFAGSPTSFHAFYTLRGHTGTLACLEADSQRVFSAGAEGVVRVWKVPMVEEIDQFGEDAELSSKLGVYAWEAHEDVVWAMKKNKVEEMLVTAGADGFLKLWK
jgi:WD40 repeat protein